MAIKNYTFLHFSIRKRCITRYKSIVYRIITHFYTIHYYISFFKFPSRFLALSSLKSLVLILLFALLTI